MITGSSIFTMALFAVSAVLFVATQSYPWRAKIFPLIATSTALILLMVQIVLDIMTSRKGGFYGEQKQKAGQLGPEHLSIGLWMVTTMLMLWIAGFMGTVVLLPFIYLRLHKESWKLSVFLSGGCGLFFYLLFGVALKMPLYPGMIGAILFG